MKKDERKIFYDTDVLSCFLSVDDVSILKKLFKEIIIPPHVYIELSRVKTLKKRVDKLKNEKFVRIHDFDVGSKTHNLYSSLRYGYELGCGIGSGEAAAIALCIVNNGILASNNTKDIIKAIRKYDLTRITTGDIFVKAYNEKLITEKEANQLWEKMIKKGRFLTKDTFSQYLKENPKNKF